MHLSSEHTGWIFEKDIEKVALAIEQHSGGKNSIAVRLGVHQF